MIYREGITINGKHSYNDFGLSIVESTIGLPKRNSIRKTVPFMNGYYDYTSMSGKITYTERPLDYTFGLLADSVQELEALKNAVVAWLEETDQSDIYDDADPGYYYVGTLDGAPDWTAENEFYGELSVKFVCQPYRISRTDGTEVI